MRPEQRLLVRRRPVQPHEVDVRGVLVGPAIAAGAGVSLEAVALGELIDALQQQQARIGLDVPRKVLVNEGPELQRRILDQGRV